MDWTNLRKNQNILVLIKNCFCIIHLDLAITIYFGKLNHKNGLLLTKIKLQYPLTFN